MPEENQSACSYFNQAFFNSNASGSLFTLKSQKLIPICDQTVGPVTVGFRLSVK